MPDPDKDDVARALERLTSGPGSAPTPQPRPRAAPTPQVRVSPSVAKTTAQKPAQKALRPAGPNAAPDQLLSAPISAARPKETEPKARRPAPGMGLRRTLIPILLTGGFLLIALAVVRFAWNSIDNPILDLPRWVVIAMVSLGAVCWLLAGANMFAVHRSLQRAGPERT